ncbi:TPA: hypothetical protein QDA97_004839, partial [Burkholderia vietnamiensis]|nr:hypothetical protein [Burkholderia vietnamiensis]
MLTNCYASPLLRDSSTLLFTVQQLIEDSLVGRVFDALVRNYQTVEKLTFAVLLGLMTCACQDGAFIYMRNGTLIPMTGY